MAENKTLPLKHGGTHLAYITDEEEKILRDLFHSKETDPEVKYFNGVPVLQDDRVRYKGRLMTADDAARREAADEKAAADAKKAADAADAAAAAAATTTTTATTTAETTTSDEDYVNYVLGNPDLRENAEAAGLTNTEIAEWGEIHWNAHGEDEGRLNTPDAQDFAPGFTQTLGLEHYQGRPVAETLQASVRAGDPSEMWEAREDISKDWNLGQYTAAGWNLDPDAPYRTGILGDTLAVNTGIGQLTPTIGGNQRFIQDRYVDASLAKDFPDEWVTDNAWTGPENLGAYWDALTSATRDASGNLVRATPYDPTTALGPSVSVGPRGTPTGGGTNISTTGPANPTVPSFGYPQYEDWTRFMPTNFQLAEGGGRHYQPGAWGGTSGTSGTVGNNIWSAGTPTGDTTATGAVGPINPNIWGTDTTTGGNFTTDTSGNKWVMSPGGQWVPAGSDYGSALTGDGRLFGPNFYDTSGAYVGSQGTDVTDARFRIGFPGTDPTGKSVGFSFSPIGPETEMTAAEVIAAGVVGQG